MMVEIVQRLKKLQKVDMLPLVYLIMLKEETVVLAAVLVRVKEV